MKAIRGQLGRIGAHPFSRFSPKREEAEGA
jgi:hypothetical protein